MILIRKYLLYAFAFSLSLYSNISTLILVALVILSFFLLIKTNKKTRLNYIIYIMPILLYFITAISIFYSDNTETKYLEQRASLIGFPLIFLTTTLDNISYKKIGLFFVKGCLVAAILCYLNAFYNSFSIIEGKLLFQPVVNEEFSFFYSVVRDGNYFFSSFFSIFHDTIYFAIYLNMAISIILSFSLWRDNKLYFLLLLIFSLTIFQLSSKIGIITCFAIFSIYLLTKITNFYTKIGFLVLILFVGFSFFQFNPRGKSMIKKFEKEGFHINPKERFGYTLRLMSWDAAMELIKENTVFGVGIGDVQPELNTRYRTKGYMTPLGNNFNAHNQFFQTFLESGIIGFILLLLMLNNLYKKELFFNQEAFFNLSFLIIIILSFLFESVLNRYSGISFFMFFYSLFLNKNIRNTND